MISRRVKACVHKLAELKAARIRKLGLADSGLSLKKHARTKGYSCSTLYGVVFQLATSQASLSPPCAPPRIYDEATNYTK
jgi:hypothetical protein